MGPFRPDFDPPVAARRPPAPVQVVAAAVRLRQALRVAVQVVVLLLVGTSFGFYVGWRARDAGVRLERELERERQQRSPSVD